MNVRQAFSLFLDDQYLKGNSLRTITDYTNKLQVFLSRFGDCELSELRLDMLNDYANPLHNH